VLEWARLFYNRLSSNYTLCPSTLVVVVVVVEQCKQQKKLAATNTRKSV
jgi:hypothetical protein